MKTIYFILLLATVSFAYISAIDPITYQPKAVEHIIYNQEVFPNFAAISFVLFIANSILAIQGVHSIGHN
jgi:hypothetical protein